MTTLGTSDKWSEKQETVTQQKSVWDQKNLNYELVSISSGLCNRPVSILRWY